MGGWRTVGAHGLMGAQMSQEGRLLSNSHTRVISEDGEGILLLCAWLTAHSPYWALASASGTGEEAAGRANLCRHICPRGIWTGVLLLAPCCTR